MRFFQNISLQRKQMLIIMLTSGIALLLACLIFVTYDVITFRRSMVSNLSTLAEIVGNNSSAALDFDDPKSAVETLSALRAEPNIEAGCVYTKDGKAFAVYDRADDKKEIIPPAPKRSGHYFKENTLHLFRQIIHNDEIVGTVYVKSDLNALYSRLGRYAAIVLGVFVLASLVAFLLSNRLQKIVSGPILHLVKTTRAVAREKNYSMRAVKQSEDELGALVDSFNEMLSEIQSRDAELQKSKDVLEDRVGERTHDLANSLSLLHATLESTADGILVADGQGKISNFNDHFVKMWKIPHEMANAKDEQRILDFVLVQLKEPEKFLAKIKDLYGRPELESFDFLEFKDGRIFERYSKPQHVGEKYMGRVWSFRDITGRKRAEEVLRRTEELYRRAIAGADAVPYSYDFKTRRYLFMGEGIEQLTGYKIHEVTPQLWKTIIQESVMAGDTAGLTKDEAAKRVSSGEFRNWRCDMRIKTRDGKSRWLADTSVQNLDESGRPTGAMGILQDITERKQSEISALVFSKLSQNLSSAASPAEAARIIGVGSDELIGWDACSIQLYSEEDDTIYSIFETDTVDGKKADDTSTDVRKATELHHRILNLGGELILRDAAMPPIPGAVVFGNKSRQSPSILYVPIRCRDRRVGILSVHSYTFNAYNEQDLRTLQTLADQCGGALERIRADEALRKSESQLRQIEELYRRAIAGADAVPYSYDYEKKSYVFMGQGIEQLIGYTPQEMTGEIWKRIIQESAMAGETIGMDKNEAARRVKAGEIRNWRCDMRVITREGKSRWISDASVQNLDESGHKTSVGILQDITERKQAEISAVAFSKLGKNLSSAASTEDAAKIITEVADELIGWDACFVQMYSESNDRIYSLFNADTIDGKRMAGTLQEPKAPNSLQQRILKSGAELILRDDPTSFLPGGNSFGDRSRPSASLIFVPIRSGTRSIGILSIQSYKLNAYDHQNLTTLQTLADQCGGAMERIRVGEAMRKSESQFRLVWETSADGMRLANREGVVLMANDAYCRMVDKPKTEVEGQNLSIFHWKDNQDYILQRHREEIAAKSFRPHLEKEVLLWNGKRIWFELSNSLLELPGQPPLMLTIFRDITQRKHAESELAIMHNQLVDTSRQAGMAEVATSVLHNVGNVLNSVNVSGSLIREKVKKSRISNLGKIAALIQEHDGKLPEFFAHDPRGKQLPGYLSQLSVYLGNEQQEVLQEIGSLVNNIEHIKEIVAMQQSYAKVSGMSESLQVIDLVEDALRMNAGALDRHQVQVIREYSEAPHILVEKHKVLQILINLIRNAKYACDEAKRNDKFIKVRVTNDQSHLTIAVIDNGIGIPPENLTRIFNHGFTTRKDGHGFGLHSGALAAIEIGGSLNAHSDGPGKGAEFILKLPVNINSNKEAIQ